MHSRFVVYFIRKSRYMEAKKKNTQNKSTFSAKRQVFVSSYYLFSKCQIEET